MSDQPLPNSEIILYQTENGRTRIQCRFKNETVGLSQKLMAELFQIGVGTVNHHLEIIFAQGKLQAGATIRRYRIVQTDGARQIARKVEVVADSVIRKFRTTGLHPFDATRLLQNLVRDAFLELHNSGHGAAYCIAEQRDTDALRQQHRNPCLFKTHRKGG